MAPEARLQAPLAAAGMLEGWRDRQVQAEAIGGKPTMRRSGIKPRVYRPWERSGIRLEITGWKEDALLVGGCYQCLEHLVPQSLNTIVAPEVCVVQIVKV